MWSDVCCIVIITLAVQREDWRGKNQEIQGLVSVAGKKMISGFWKNLERRK